MHLSEQRETCASGSQRKWLLRLTGEDADIGYLADGFPRGESPILRLGDSAYLTDARMARAVNASEALALGRELLAELNGCALVVNPGFQIVSSESVAELSQDGTICYHVIGSGGLKMRVAALCGMGNVIGGELPHNPHTWPLKDASIAVREHPELRHALHLFGHLPHTWRNLYLVYDVIANAFGGESELINQPWVPSGLELFKRTANNYNAIGSEARHARTDWAPPLQPITLHEASELFRLILAGWIAARKAAVVTHI